MMDNIVVSKYKIYKSYCEFEKEIVTENKNWSIKVYNHNDSHKLINYNASNYYLNKIVNEIINSYKYKMINEILLYIKERCKKNNIRFSYSIIINCSHRILISSSNQDLEEKYLLEVDAKFYREKECLLSDSYSDFFDNFDCNYLQRKLDNDYDSALLFYNAELIKNIPNNVTYHFSALSAAIINHEIFGHYFESDSVKSLDQIDPITLPCKVNIFDSPKAKLGGFCTFDDFGVHLEKTDLVKNGEVLRRACIDNRRAGEKIILPRMTNTIIHTIEKRDNCNLNGVIDVQNIYRAKLSKNKVVVLIDAGYYRIGEKIFRLPFFKIESSAIQFLKGIYSFGETECFLSSVYCIKKGECCGGIGIASPDMYVNI